MLSPVDFMQQYRRLRVETAVEDAAARVSRRAAHVVQLRNYFMMDWETGTEERRDFDHVTRGSRDDPWFRENRESILTAAMGKGAPRDYEIALEWGVRSRRIPTVNETTLQAYCDDHLGIDCSGFVTNYLAACGKRTYSHNFVRNTNAASFFQPGKAINDPTRIQQGDLLVWMRGNVVKVRPGHIAVVASHVAQSRVGGNMRVVEATGASGATPKLLDSMYVVEQIIPRGGALPVMVLVVKRHGVSGHRVAVIRP